MPKFKNKGEALPSFNYTRRGFFLGADGRLHLPKGISLVVLWSRELPAGPSSVRVFRDVLGHWHASFVVTLAVEDLRATGGTIGIDGGVTETAVTTHEAFDLPHAQHGKSAARRLAHYQRQMSRRKPAKASAASRGYRQAKRRVAKAYRHVARQRQDDRRKWAKRVVANFEQIAVEDFRPKFLANSTMARKAADGAIAATKGRADLAGDKARARPATRVARVHDDGLQRLRCESQAPSVAVRANLYLRGVRTCRPKGCELRGRDGRQGRFQPSGVDRTSPETPPEPLAS